MHIEINAGGLGAGIAVAEYQLNMSSFISDAEGVISSFKAVSSKVHDLNGGVGSLQGAVDDISSRIQLEEEKKEAAVAVQKKSNDFLDLAIRVDKQVASLVDKNKDEFYKTNPWMKPAVTVDDTPWYEDAWNWLCGVGETVVEGVKQTWIWIKDTSIDAWVWVKDTAQKAWNGLVELYNDLVENYNNHGLVYDLVQYGKVAWKVAEGIVKIIGAVGAFSTGVGIPIAILSIISAGNDIINAANDAAYIFTDQYDKVGATNLLKDTLVDGYGELGKLLGNEEAGEFAGELVYIGIDIVSFLNGADKMLKSFGKLNTDIYGNTKYSFVWGETSFDDLFDNEFDGLSKLSLEKIIKGDILKIHPDSTFSFVVDTIEESYKTYSKGSSVAEKIINLFVS